MNRLALLTCMLASLFVHAADLPRSTPEAQGVSSAQVRAFVEAADQQINTMNSFMLVRHGQVVAEGWWTPFSAESPHALYSLSKSFTSTAVGFAISEGKLSLDDEVLKFFPDLAPAEPSKNLKAMRVRDLLIMSGGQESEAKLNNSTTVPWAKIFLEHPVQFKPGTHFVYNTPGTFMLSNIVQKVTGQPVLEYLRPRLFEPLGIVNPTWSANFQGINFGGWGLSIRTEDIAKFGVFVSQKGKWDGKQLLPATWIEAATLRQTSTGSSPNSDWDQGYGYQFWRCRHGAFRGDGAMGQYCIVIPEQDAVVAITSGVKDMQSVLNVVWDKLLPAFQPNALPENKDEQALLVKALSTLSVRQPQGNATSPSAAALAGKEFTFAANKEKLESLKLEIDSKDSTATLVLKVNANEYRVKCGNKTWEKSRLAFGTFIEQPVAASAAWTAENTLTVQLCFYETPNQILASLQFSGNELLLDTEILPGSAKQPQLKGQTK